MTTWLAVVLGACVVLSALTYAREGWDLWRLHRLEITAPRNIPRGS